MSSVKQLNGIHADAVHWRQHLHSIPETNFDVFRTADFVATKLQDFGCDEVAKGIAKTGVVGIIRGRLGDGPTIGLRADMDALPIKEATGKAYASTHEGKMHACGHDGHMAMLLGAAKYLASTRKFFGSAALIFQPAEEGGGGGKVMVDEGLMERFGIEKVFGMHNMPGIPIGNFAIRPGPIMAGTAEFTLKITGRGGHAAMPHKAIDPISIGNQIVNALNAIVSRNVDPINSAVLSVTRFHAGDAVNVIPDTTEIGGTVRTLHEDVAEAVRKRIYEISEGIAAAHGASAVIEYKRNYPVMINHPAETSLASDVAALIANGGSVDRNTPPIMGAEDFSHMLNARPGAYIFLGNGHTADLHNASYDFNDEALPYGIDYWVRLVETVAASCERNS